jgi:hypothetical protein
VYVPPSGPRCLEARVRERLCLDGAPVAPDGHRYEHEQDAGRLEPRGVVAPAVAGYGSRRGRPTLHIEIECVLRLNGGGPMSAHAIAAAVTSAGRYRKRDGSPVAAEQIHARVSKHPERFERTADGIRLSDAHATIDETPVEQAGDTAAPWYWEGSVQASVARFLVAAGWTIESAADRLARSRNRPRRLERGPPARGTLDVRTASSLYERASRASLRRFA